MAWWRLAVCSPNVAIYIISDYIVRQTINLVIIVTLSNLCSEMAIAEGGISKLKTDKRGTDSKLQQMDGGFQWLNKEVEDTNFKMKFLKTGKEDLYIKQLYAEAYSCRENLV